MVGGLGVDPVTEAQLLEIGFALIDEGWRPDRQPYGDVLARGQDDLLHTSFQAGLDVVVFAVCDQACLDLDVIVRGPNGAELGRDELPDSVPVVEFHTGLAGRYEFIVGMYESGVVPSQYALAVFTR